MNGPNSLGDTILLVDDDGTATVLEPLEDQDADMTPEERRILLDYLERTRKLYRPGQSAPETPRPPEKARRSNIEIDDDLDVCDIELSDDDEDPPPQIPLRTVGPRSPKGSGPSNAAAFPPKLPNELDQE